MGCPISPIRAGLVGEQVIDLRGRDIDVNSPTFQAASKACQKVVPGSK